MERKCVSSVKRKSEVVTILHFEVFVLTKRKGVLCYYRTHYMTYDANLIFIKAFSKSCYMSCFSIYTCGYAVMNRHNEVMLNSQEVVQFILCAVFSTLNRMKEEYPY